MLASPHADHPSHPLFDDLPGSSDRNADHAARSHRLMKPEARRALVERIFEKAQENGQTIEDDPLFVSWIEEWIAGDIEIAELREKYRSFLTSRGHSKPEE